MVDHAPECFCCTPSTSWARVEDRLCWHAPPTWCRQRLGRCAGSRCIHSACFKCWPGCPRRNIMCLFMFQCFIVFTAQTPASRHTEWCGIWCAWCYWSTIWRWRHWKHICMHTLARGTSNRVPCADTGIPSRWIDGQTWQRRSSTHHTLWLQPSWNNGFATADAGSPPDALDRGPHPAALNQSGGALTDP